MTPLISGLKSESDMLLTALIRQGGATHIITNGDGVDGVSIAVVVAVVFILSSITTGDNEDAPETSPACNDSMLQRRLWTNNALIMSISH